MKQDPKGRYGGIAVMIDRSHHVTTGNEMLCRPG